MGKNDRNKISERVTNAGVLFRAARYLDTDQLKDLPPGVFRQNTPVKFSNSYITMLLLFLLPDVKKSVITSINMSYAVYKSSKFLICCTFHPNFLPTTFHLYARKW